MKHRMQGEYADILAYYYYFFFSITLSHSRVIQSSGMK